MKAERMAFAGERRKQQQQRQQLAGGGRNQRKAASGGHSCSLGDLRPSTAWEVDERARSRAGGHLGLNLFGGGELLRASGDGASIEALEREAESDHLFIKEEINYLKNLQQINFDTVKKYS